MLNQIWGRKALSATALALALLTTACGSSSGGEAADSAPVAAASEEASDAATASISIKDFDFSGDFKVAPGTVITVTNNDGAPHTLTSSDDKFDTETLAPGESAQITVPDAAGDYAFFCSIHPSMTGTIVVSG